jgi:hypothetical protein
VNAPPAVDSPGVGEKYGEISLTGAERAAVFELGQRPTFAICPGAEGPQVAELTALADRITAAAGSGRLPPELHPDVRELLREAIHETRHELWHERRGLERWHSGDVSAALAGVPEEEHEHRYVEQIDRCAQLLAALTSLALKLWP